MIRINLLPVEERKRRRMKPSAEAMGAAPSGGGISPLTVLILLLCYAVVVVLGYWVYKQKVEDERTLKEKRDALAEVKKEIKSIEKQYAEIKKLKELTQNQLEVLNALDPVDRLLWAEKINMIAELIPDGVYITQIMVKENVQEKETPESLKAYDEWVKKGKQGTRPRPIKKPIITQYLTLDGVSRAELPEDRLRLISAFNEALQTFHWKTSSGKIHKFYDHFRGEIDPSDMEVIRIENIPVTKFSFTLTTKTFGE